MSRLSDQGPMTMRRTVAQSFDVLKRTVSGGLSQGITPRRLALTLALGFAIGCLPVVGMPTLVCAALALALRLNLPAIQAANYSVMPLQLMLIVPFVRLGGWLIRARVSQASSQPFAASQLVHASPRVLFTEMGWVAGQALLAWLLIAIPAVLLLTLTLPRLLRRIPAVAAAEAGD